MDKKKVIELIEDTILMVDTIEGFDDGDTEQLLNVRRKLNDALEELSKPDWISVEDELPPYNEEVLVCSKKCPNVTWVDSRDPNMLILNGFRQERLFRNTITHWRKIDKLEV